MPTKVELEKTLKDKDKQIRELQKVNFESQEMLKKLLLSDLDPKVKDKVLKALEKDDGAEEFQSSLEEKDTEIKKLKDTLESREKLLLTVEDKFRELKQKQQDLGPTDAQTHIMKSAIQKIKDLQKNLEEKTDQIGELRRIVKEWNTNYSNMVLQNEEEMTQKDAEIKRMETEFVSFKEEFMSELKRLEASGEAIDAAGLREEAMRLQRDNETLRQYIAQYQAQINELQSSVMTKESEMERLKGKLFIKDQNLRNVLTAQETGEVHHIRDYLSPAEPAKGQEEFAAAPASPQYPPAVQAPAVQPAAMPAHKRELIEAASSLKQLEGELDQLIEAPVPEEQVQVETESLLRPSEILARMRSQERGPRRGPLPKPKPPDAPLLKNLLIEAATSEVPAKARAKPKKPAKARKRAKRKAKPAKPKEKLLVEATPAEVTAELEALPEKAKEITLLEEAKEEAILEETKEEAPAVEEAEAVPEEPEEKVAPEEGKEEAPAEEEEEAGDLLEGEELEIFNWIIKEIPSISESEALILVSQLMDYPEEDREARLDFYKTTKELEEEED